MIVELNVSLDGAPESRVVDFLTVAEPLHRSALSCPRQLKVLFL